MPRYVLADNATGDLLGVELASAPINACRMHEARLGARGRVYEQHEPRGRSATATPNAYAVYEAVGDHAGAPGVITLAKAAVVVVLGESSLPLR